VLQKTDDTLQMGSIVHALTTRWYMEASFYMSVHSDSFVSGALCRAVKEGRMRFHNRLQLTIADSKMGC